MSKALEYLNSSNAARFLLACLLGLLPFLVLPNTNELIQSTILPDATRLQQEVLSKLFLAVLVLIAGFGMIGPSRLGFVLKPFTGKGQLVWLVPACFLFLNLSRGGTLRFASNDFSVQDALLIIVWALAVALWEETFYRGIMFDVLKPFGTRACVLFSSFWFGVVHYQLGGWKTLGAAVIGLALANAYAVTQTIIPAIVIHFGVNLSARFVSVTNEHFYFEVIATSVLLGIVSIVILYWMPRLTLSAKNSNDDP